MALILAQPFRELIGTTWDAGAESNKRYKTLTANTSLTITNAPENFEALLEVTQDGTGSRTLSINGTSVAIKTAATSVTMIGILNVAGTLRYYPEGGSSASTDTIAPIVTSMETLSNTTLQVAFSETVTATSIGWSFKKNGSSLTVNSVSGSGSSFLVFSVAKMDNGDTITASYSGGNCKDTALNELDAFTDVSVTNNIPVPVLENLDFSVQIGLSATSNVWTGVTGDTLDWQNYGKASKYLAAGNDGYIQWQYVANDGKAILAFNSTNANERYANPEATVFNYEVGAFVSSTGEVFRLDNNTSAQSTGVTISTGDYIRIIRASGVLKLQKSTDATAWTDVYTFTYTTSLALYINTNMSQGVKIYYPKGYNLS
jgi:hypothetical protein